MRKLTILFSIIILFSSCNSSKEIVYMQDAASENFATRVIEYSIKVQPKDILSIIVSSKNPELASLFNLQTVSNSKTNEFDALSINTQQRQLGYTVNSKGNIDFPILGQINVEGLTKEEVAKLIKKQIKAENYIQDPIVTVDFTNLKFSILGEVKSPGTYSIDGDRLTILQAIGMAQDLTIYGKRGSVQVIRENGSERMTYYIDLRSSDFFSSPAYYIQQNDVIYIQPNNVRAGQSTVNDNNFKSISLWTSLATLLTTIAVLIWK